MRTSAMLGGAALALVAVMGCSSEKKVVRHETIQTIPAAPAVVEKRTVIESETAPVVVEKKTTTVVPAPPVIERKTTVIEEED